MDTQDQNETPENKVAATDPQTDVKTTINNQELEDKKIEAKELNEAEIDEVAAAGRVFSWKEPVVM